MTWIIGLPSIFGYAHAVSDVQVTWENGERRDCLQKVYPIAPFIIGGFAGSVQLGFNLLDHLQRNLSIAEPGGGWILRYVAGKWCRTARQIYKRAPENLRRLGCEIILLGASPSENAGDLDIPRTDVVVLRAPDFEPEYASPAKCISIGSGSQTEIYKQELERINANPFPMMQMEVGNPGGTALALSIHLTSLITQNPIAGISPHLQIVSVTRGGYFINTNDHTQYPGDAPPIEFKMPPLAKNWKEFQKISEGFGFAATGAVSKGVNSNC